MLIESIARQHCGAVRNTGRPHRYSRTSGDNNSLLQLQSKYLPNIPSLENVRGWCMAGSDRMPPTPGPNIAPSAQPAGAGAMFDNVTKRVTMVRAGTRGGRGSGTRDGGSTTSGIVRHTHFILLVGSRWGCGLRHRCERRGHGDRRKVYQRSRE